MAISKNDFIETIKEGAISTQKEFGVFASVTIAQGIMESSYGNSFLAKTDNNLFGVKFYGVHNPNLNITQGTWATDDGGYYCHYESWADSINDHGYFLRNNKRYEENGVFSAKDYKEQVNAIAKAGYASDPNYSSLIIGEIEYFKLFEYDNVETPSNKVNEVVQWAIDIANDDTHGYDQANRWSPDYDCSSFIIQAYENFGIPYKSSGATYTGNMKSVGLKIGFNEVDWKDDVNNLKSGDILLNEINHVAMYIGNGNIVHASINEFGGVAGGQTGDQTGKEICVRTFYVYSKGWDCVLRYKDGGEIIPPIEPPEPENTEEVFKAIDETFYNVSVLTEEQQKFIKTLKFNDEVMMKHTFNRRKKEVGVNFYGSKLTFDTRIYIIDIVEKNGFIRLKDGSFFKKVNPKYIKGVNKNEN